MRVAPFALAALVLSACEPSTFVPIDDNDPAMIAAIADGRRTLPTFWAAYDADPEVRETAMIKVGLTTDGGGEEHIWAESITREGEVIRGRLANRPEHLPGLQMGSEVVIEPDRISDWGYEKNGKLWGVYTQRVMMKNMPEAEAAEMRAWLSPTPLESGQ